MLRLVSIIGIAIAMVIGFVAISTKMKDDYTVRSRIVDVIDQMKNLATNELQCGETRDDATSENASSQDASSSDVASTADKANVPETEISRDLEPIPLVDSPDSDQSGTAPPSDAPVQETSSEDPSTNDTVNSPADSADAGTSQSDEQQPEQQSGNNATLQDDELERNADIIKTVGYRRSISGALEVIVIFKDIVGESGKTLVTSGSQLAVRCACEASELSCATVRSDINKNYLPKSLTKN